MHRDARKRDIESVAPSLRTARFECAFGVSGSRLDIALAHDLFRKPVSTRRVKARRHAFRGHALMHRADARRCFGIVRSVTPM
jgi:hypothetical protein